MPFSRAAARAATTFSTSITAAPVRGGYGTRAFSAKSSMKAGHAEAHEEHYDPPSGWLWGIKPGEKPEKEGWEGVFVYGFFGCLILGAVGYAFKPDTS
jgi:hypothetical protein